MPAKPRQAVLIPAHAGAVAGALAISTTQPLDIVRVRLQQSAAARPLGAGMQRGVLGSLQHMIRSGAVEREIIVGSGQQAPCAARRACTDCSTPRLPG